jgi:hypothetical protein
MIKSLVLLLNMLGLFLLNLFFSGSVSLNMVAPKEVNAGKEFEVEVTLDKGDVSSFARFQQDLPAGLSAQVVDASNAEFSFKDQKVRFVWLRLPSQSTVIIRYKVTVNDRLTGNFKLNGKFSFIEDNERKEVLVTDQLLAIVPDPNLDPKMLVDIGDYQQMASSKMLAGGASVAAIRQEPYMEGQSNDYIVNILVNKGATDKFAKIEEDVPEGYKAEVVDSKDGIFTFKDQKVKFLWMTLPAEQSFVVSYRLIPEEALGSKPLTLKGTFSFIQNDATQVIDIVQKSTNLHTLTARQLEALTQTTSVSGETQNSVSSSYTPNAAGGVEIPIKYVGAEKMAELDQKHRSTKAAVTSPETNLSYTLEPEKGVYYRVQIAAGHKLVNIRRYFRKFKLNEEVRTEQHEGWYKYSVGSFYVYKDAHDYRIKLWDTTPIADAFVAAYNNGKRITVQEALMITNHKWYK